MLLSQRFCFSLFYALLLLGGMSSCGESFEANEGVKTTDSLTGPAEIADSLLLDSIPMEASKDSLLTEPAPPQPDPRQLAVAAVDSFRTKPYLTFSLYPKFHELAFFNPRKTGGTHTFTSVANWAATEGKELRFICNGGMFQADRSAQGLLILEGKELHPLDKKTKGYGNFYLQPNGVFALDEAGKAYVVPTADFPALAKKANIRYATQSGPMMVVDGSINPLFNDGSPNLHIRNAVGTAPDGKLVFALSQEEITFYELSRLMIQQGCTNVLYLDGFVSRAYLPELGFGSLEEGEGLGPLIAVFR